MGWTVEVAGRSDVGCVRTNNEDNFGYDSRCGIYVVCDGMGGQAAGEVASKMAVDALLTYFRECKRTNRYPRIGEPIEGVSVRAQALGSAIWLANTVVYQSATEHASQAGMGSTIVSVLIGEQGFYSIGNVGDSRIYLVRDGTIEQLTHDHSLVMEQVRRGLITIEEANQSDVQNIILRALGAEEQVKADVDDIMARPGDTLVMCSDGLTRELTDSRICSVVSGTPNLSEACATLIEDAKQAGGNDNVTVVLLRFKRYAWYESLWRWLTGADQSIQESQ